MVFADHTQLASKTSLEAEGAYAQGVKFAADGQHELAVQSFETGINIGGDIA